MLSVIHTKRKTFVIYWIDDIELEDELIRLLAMTRGPDKQKLDIQNVFLVVPIFKGFVGADTSRIINSGCGTKESM